MAPEQCLSEPLDARTDIYALGIVLYELATGRGPFEASDVQAILRAQIEARPIAPRAAAPERDLPAELDRVVLRCLRKDPRGRYANVAALEADLLALYRAVAPRDDRPGFDAAADRTAPPGPAPAPPGSGARRAERRGDTALEIAPGVWRLGERTDELLATNTYLLQLTGGGRTYRVLVDPGPPDEYDALLDGLHTVLGPDAAVDVLFANHQDMDVALNVTRFQAAMPDAVLVCSEDAWRVLRHAGADPRRVRTVESFWNRRLTLPTGHTLCFEPTPHCHARGATMLYEPAGRILFTGDLLGGFSVAGDAAGGDEASFAAAWDGVRLYHRLYMPSRDALRYAVSRILALDPPPRLVAPQHGPLVPEGWLPALLRRLERLPVGLEAWFTEVSSENYLRLLNELLPELRESLGRDHVERVLHRLETDPSFPRALEFVDGVLLGFRVEPRSITSAVLQRLLRGVPEPTRTKARQSARAAFEHRDVPPPDWLVSDAPGGDDARDDAPSAAPLLVEIG